jgi:hypothetical protein
MSIETISIFDSFNDLIKSTECFILSSYFLQIAMTITYYIILCGIIYIIHRQLMNLLINFYLPHHPFNSVAVAVDECEISAACNRSYDSDVSGN